MKSKTVTCSFTLDRKIYNKYKSVVVKNGENVTGNIIQYMLDVIQHNIPNIDTIKAIEEVQELKKDKNKKNIAHFMKF